MVFTQRTVYNTKNQLVYCAHSNSAMRHFDLMAHLLYTLVAVSSFCGSLVSLAMDSHRVNTQILIASVSICGVPHRLSLSSFIAKHSRFPRLKTQLFCAFVCPQHFIMVRWLFTLNNIRKKKYVASCGWMRTHNKKHNRKLFDEYKHKWISVISFQMEFPYFWPSKKSLSSLCEYFFFSSISFHFLAFSPYSLHVDSVFSSPQRIRMNFGYLVSSFWFWKHAQFYCFSCLSLFAPLRLAYAQYALSLFPRVVHSNKCSCFAQCAGQAIVYDHSLERLSNNSKSKW